MTLAAYFSAKEIDSPDVQDQMTWFDLDNLLSLRNHSNQAWTWFVALNVVFLIIWVAIAPRLRAIIRQWLQWDEEFWRRLSEYYGAFGGPAVIQRNLIPELSIALYAYLAANAFWALESSVIPGLFLLVSVDCILIWKGESVARQLASLFSRKRQRQLTPEETAELNPLEFRGPN